MTGGLLVIVDGRATELAAPGPHLIGRHSDSAVLVDHDLVSRRHLQVSWTEGAWVAEDMGSANGTHLDGEVIERIRLDAETVVGLGGGEGEGALITLRPPVAPAPPPQPVAPVSETLGGGAAPSVAAPVDGADSGPMRPERDDEAVTLTPSELGRPLRVHALGSGVVTIGRAEDNTIVLNDLQASRHHAEIRVLGSGQHEVRDLDSFNGTFVGGERVHGARIVGDDLIAIGSRILRVTDTGVEEHSATDHFPVAAKDIRVVTDDGAVLLDDISFVLEEASLMAVLGPSGAGKSTLLGALTGLRPASSGRVLCAGRDLYSNFDDLSRRIGYVPQDDLVQPELTVAQSIDYAARLRFPPDVSAEERDRRVTEVMEELGLAHRAGVRVGALSGGQRKRVSIALELLTKPSLLFLDEPTSGLDPGYERSVMMVLRRLADSGRTVILVTHSVESLHLCDRILCLAPGGRTAWFGPPEATAAYFGKSTYQEIFQILDSQGARDHAAAGSDNEALDPVEWKERFAADPAAERYVEAPLAAYEQALEVPEGAEPETRRGPSVRGWFRQLLTLTQRYARIVVSDRRTLTILAVTAPVLGLVLLLRLPPWQLGDPPNGSPPLFSQSALVLFILAMGLTQVATSTSIREIVKERAILDRERTVGVSVSAYVLSKVVVLGALALVQATIIVGVATARQGGPDPGLVLGSGRLELIVVGALTALGAMALGLLVSAIVRSPDRVALILPAVLGFHLIVTSGEVMPAAPEIPVVEQARYLSTARWGYAAMAATADVEERALTSRVLSQVATEGAEDALELRTRSDLAELAPVDRDLAHDPAVWWRNVGVLVLLTSGMVIAAIVVLRRADSS